MLPKPYRLNLKTDFSFVAKGKRLESPYLKLFIQYGDNNQPKIGISTSAKVLKQAVQRNRARRLIATAFSHLYTKFPNNINIIVLPKTEIINLTADQIEDHLNILLVQANILQ